MQLAPVSLLGYSLARARAGARVKLGTARWEPRRGVVPRRGVGNRAEVTAPRQPRRGNRAEASAPAMKIEVERNRRPRLGAVLRLRSLDADGIGGALRRWRQLPLDKPEGTSAIVWFRRHPPLPGEGSASSVAVNRKEPHVRPPQESSQPRNPSAPRPDRRRSSRIGLHQRDQPGGRPARARPRPSEPHGLLAADNPPITAERPATQSGAPATVLGRAKPCDVEPERGRGRRAREVDTARL